MNFQKFLEIQAEIEKHLPHWIWREIRRNVDSGTVSLVMRLGPKGCAGTIPERYPVKKRVEEIIEEWQAQLPYDLELLWRYLEGDLPEARYKNVQNRGYMVYSPLQGGGVWYFLDEVYGQLLVSQ